MRKIKVKPTFLTPLFKENLKNEMEKEMAAHSNILAWNSMDCVVQRMAKNQT